MIFRVDYKGHFESIFEILMRFMQLLRGFWIRLQNFIGYYGNFKDSNRNLSTSLARISGLLIGQGLWDFSGSARIRGFLK